MEQKGKRDMERACDPYSSKYINENECAAKWLNFVWVVHEWQCVFFAIALFALCWWSVVLSHSLSLFADFLSFTPRTFTDGLLYSLFDHLLFLVLCFLLNSYSFFLSLPFTHTQTNIFRKKTMMLMVMIHSICIRSHCTNLSKGKTNETEPSKYKHTHTTPTTTYIHTNAHCAHYKSDTVDSNNKSQRWVERKKSNTTKSNGKEKTQTPCCLERCRIFFSLWTFERNHTFSLVSSIVTLARLNHNTHNFESPLQRTFFFIKFSVCSRHDFVSLNIRIETTTQKGCVLLSKYFCFAFFLSALIVQVTYYFVPA